MPRKKKEKIDNEKVEASFLEKEFAKKKQENEVLKQVIDERKKLLKELEELEAKERLIKIQKQEENNDEQEENNDEPEETIPFDFSSLKIDKPEKPVEEIKPSRFEELLRRFNEKNEGTIEIYRIENGKELKIGKFPVKEYGVDLDNVAKKYGGGEYKMVLRNPDGTFAGAITEYYDELAYPKPTINNLNTPLIIPQPQNYDNLVSVILNIQRENQKMMMDFSNKIVEAIGQRNNFINSIKDIVEIKELVKDDKINPTKTFEAIMDSFYKGIELGKMFSNSESDEGFLSVFKYLPLLLGVNNKPDIKQAVKEIKEKISTQPNTPQIRENPYQPSEPPKIENKKEEKMSESLLLKMYKPIILEYAKNNKDPHDVAVQIFSKIPEPYFPICYDFTLLPSRVDEVITFIPELKDYREWVDKVLEEGKILFQEYFKELEEE